MKNSKTEEIKKRDKITQKTKRNMLLLTAFFLLIAVIVAVLYFTIWRYHVTTDDAYVSGDLVQVTPQVSGTVQAIYVDDTDVVKAGQILVTLETSDAQLAFDKAKSDLSMAVRQFHTQKSQVDQAESAIIQANASKGEAEAQVNLAQAQLSTAQDDYSRRKKLAGTDAVSPEELKHAKDAMLVAQAQLAQAKSGLAVAEAQINTANVQKQTALAVIGNNLDLQTQPSVQSGIAAVRSAWLNLERTKIKAPIDGQIAKRNVQLGQTISVGTPLMAVVPLHELWVDANFKETQLKDIRIGQEVVLTSDLYGDDVTYHGVVQGLSAGTGSAFAVLPAQNATGNWIKIVQRVPIRILLRQDEIDAHPLRVGLSMNVDINTRDQSKPLVATKQIETGPIANNVNPSIEGANQIIDDILNAK